MSRPSVRRPRRLAAVAAFFLLLTPFSGRSAEPKGQGFECQRNFGTIVVGIGSTSQMAVHYRLFVNRYHAPAKRRANGRLAGLLGGCREDARGLVAYYGADDATVLQAIERRHLGPGDSLGRPYMFYGLDRSLSLEEKTRSETDPTVQKITPDPILQLPLWVDGLAVAYNLSCQTGNPRNALRLSSLALSQIYSGAITSWDDPLITQSNPKLSTCGNTIRVAVRADASHSSALFKDYLSKRNPSWQPFVALDDRWPSTLAEDCRGGGDVGMATCVRGQPDSIGYVSFPTAYRWGLRRALVENRSGQFVDARPAQCTAAAQSASSYPDPSGDWSTFSLTDPTSGYPVCGLQFGLAYQRVKAAYGPYSIMTATRTMKDYLKWAVLPATQAALSKFGLARLPEKLRVISEDGAESIVWISTT